MKYECSILNIKNIKLPRYLNNIQRYELSNNKCHWMIFIYTCFGIPYSRKVSNEIFTSKNETVVPDRKIRLRIHKII
jgi:hypothetical protein